MGLTVGQMYLNILLPILLVNVMYWGAGDTSGLPEQTIETLNGWTSSEWIIAWVSGNLVPVESCTSLRIEQLFEYACQNDFYYDAETSASESGSGEERRRRHIGPRRRQSSIFLTHREASNFLLHRSKRFRGRTRRSTTISAECCGTADCDWEEIGEYCAHPREWHLP